VTSGLTKKPFETLNMKIAIRIIALNVLFIFTFLLYGTPFVSAAPFTQAFLRLDRLRASTATGGLVCANPPTVGTEATVQVAFPAGFTVNGTAGNWTVTTTNLPSGSTAWPGIGTATTVSSQTVTFPSTDLTVGILYCFNFSGTTTLTNNTAGDSQTGTITTRTSAPATIDSSSYAVAIIAEDQVTVTATVGQIFTFALSGTTMPLGVLSTSASTSSTSRTLSLSTNAPNGWIAWVRSANAGLLSATTGTSIASPGTSNNTPDSLAAQAGYVLGVAITTDGAGSGTVTQASNFGAEFVDSANSGGRLSTTFDPIAASSGTTDGDVLTATAKARVSAIQAPATDYTDTLTFVAAGRF
jgi:hypothetical protein